MGKLKGNYENVGLILYFASYLLDGENKFKIRPKNDDVLRRAHIIKLKSHIAYCMT